MPTTITLGDPASDSANAHTVYARAAWADDWEQVEHLWADEIVWATAPGISTARLFYDYGLLQHPGERRLLERARLSNYNRLYVKIVQEHDGGTTTRAWYGVVEVVEDQQGASLYQSDGNIIPTGEQVLTAYGLESLLDLEEIRRSRFTPDDAAGEWAARGLVFNREGAGNRSPSKIGGSYVFGEDPSTVAAWCTRDIVEYLLEHAGPVDNADAENVPFALADETTTVLSTWDEPELDQDGRTVWNLLNALINRQRATLCYFTVDEATSPDTVELVVESYAQTAITHALGDNLPANSSQINLVIDQDRTAAASLKLTSLRQYDRVTARGRRRRCCFSISYTDGTLEGGWTSSEENAYEIAFSTDTGYGSLGPAERQKRNAEVRAREELRHVYRRFGIPWGWNGKVKDGVGGTEVPAIPATDNPSPADDPEPHYDFDLRILPTLPLKEGVDYTGSKIPDETFDDSNATEETGPLLFWKIPGASRYVEAERMAEAAEQLEETADADNTGLSTSIRVAPDDRALEIRVQGAPQHAIAENDFTRLVDDEDVGDHDWRDAVLTVAIEEDRYAESSYGSDASADLERTKIIWAGDRYKCDFVAEGAVVSLSDSGTLEHASGPGFVADNRDELLEIATLAHAWYSQARATLALRTENPTTSLSLGQMVLALNTEDLAGGDAYYEAINTVITEIRVLNPRGEETDPGPTVQQITTGAGELDALQLVEPAAREPAAGPEYQPAYSFLPEPTGGAPFAGGPALPPVDPSRYPNDTGA